MMLLSAVVAFGLNARLNPQASWKTAFLPGGFSISTPTAVKSIGAPNAEDDATTRYWVAISDSMVFTVSVVDFKDEVFKSTTSDQILANSVAGFAVGHGGELKAQKDIVKNGWPGVEIECVDKKGLWGKARCYIVGHAEFQCLVGKIGSPPDAAVADRYLDSMSTPDRAGRGPQKAAGPEFKITALAGAGVSVRLPAPPAQSEGEFGPKASPIKLTRFDSMYGNRNYGVAFGDLPDAAFAAFGSTDEMLQKLNLESMNAVQATDRKDRFYSLGDLRVLSSTGKIDTFGGIRIDTLVKGHRMYSFIAETPAVLTTSAEVTAFFDSIKFESAN